MKLLDFGIAKQLESLDGAPDHTRTGMRLMTPAYAAPEQIRGGRIGIHTDVYSLGVVLYELLTGRLPFDLARPHAGRGRARSSSDGARASVAGARDAACEAARAQSRATRGPTSTCCA